MTAVVILGALFTLVLGFSLSGLLVNTKLQNTNKTIKGITFIMLGNIFSVSVMAIMIFIAWPTQI